MIAKIYVTLIAAGLIVMTLAACTPTATDVSAAYAVKPTELKDCQFFELRNSEGSHITVVRCPNSTTSTTLHTKTPITTIVIDGKEYVEKE